MPKPIDIGNISQQLTELSRVEARINERLSNRDFRKQLFEDPVKVLRQEGIALPKEQEQSVTTLFKSARVPEDADLRMSSNAAPTGIFISIGIRF